MNSEDPGYYESALPQCKGETMAIKYEKTIRYQGSHRVWT